MILALFVYKCSYSFCQKSTLTFISLITHRYFLVAIFGISSDFSYRTLSKYFEKRQAKGLISLDKANTGDISITIQKITDASWDVITDQSVSHQSLQKERGRRKNKTKQNKRIKE